MFQHLHQFLDGDRQYVWAKVYKYDKAVRNNLAKDNSLIMGVMDLKLWQNISWHIKRPMWITFWQSPVRNLDNYGRSNKKGSLLVGSSKTGWCCDIGQDVKMTYFLE